MGQTIALIAVSMFVLCFVGTIGAWFSDSRLFVMLAKRTETASSDKKSDDATAAEPAFLQVPLAVSPIAAPTEAAEPSPLGHQILPAFLRKGGAMPKMVTDDRIVDAEGRKIEMSPELLDAAIVQVLDERVTKARDMLEEFIRFERTERRLEGRKRRRLCDQQVIDGFETDLRAAQLELDEYNASKIDDVIARLEEEVLGDAIEAVEADEHVG